MFGIVSVNYNLGNGCNAAYMRIHHARQEKVVHITAAHFFTHGVYIWYVYHMQTTSGTRRRMCTTTSVSHYGMSGLIRLAWSHQSGHAIVAR